MADNNGPFGRPAAAPSVADEDGISAWVAAKLGSPLDLATGFSDGLALARLLTAVTGRRLRVQKVGIQNKVVCLDNIQVCIEFAEHLGLTTQRNDKRKLESKMFYNGDIPAILQFLSNLRTMFPSDEVLVDETTRFQVPPTRTAENTVEGKAAEKAQANAPEAAQCRLVSLISTKLGDGTQEESDFIKLTKQFNKGKIEGEDFVVKVRESMGESDLTALNEMVKVLEERPEVQSTLLEAIDKVVEGGRESLESLGELPGANAEDSEDEVAQMTPNTKKATLLCDKLDQAEEISLHKATFNNLAHDLFLEQTRFMNLRDRPTGKVPAKILELQGLVIETLDLKHVIALHKYRIVKESYGNANEELINKMQGELEKMELELKEVADKCSEAQSAVSSWMEDDLSRVERELEEIVKPAEEHPKQGLAAKIEAAYSDDDKVTQYRIECELSFGGHKSHTWTVSHRYSEFASLYSLFTKKKKIKLPRMPPKRFFDHGPEVVQERVLGLGEVLAEMIEVAHDDQDLKDFLAPLDSSFPQSLEEQVDGRHFSF